MKLFAQHGAQEGEKITDAVSQQLIDGVIYSPRDIALDSLKTKLTQLRKQNGKLERLFDPQYYAIFLRGSDDSRLGYLMEDYTPYLQPRRRGQLERDQQVRDDLTAALKFQAGLNVSALVAPNILISRSFDSVEAVIAKNFIRQTGPVYATLREKRPVYATLAVSRDALNDKQELLEFLNEITVLDEPPDGFYVLVSARSAEARSDIYHADVIARWMLINHSLAINGFKVINGYSDVLTPFLGAAGAEAGALGWWSNLRTFSLDRFGPSPGGGRLPVQRYLSKRLLNRITFYELDALRGTNPKILNGLPLDSLYDPNNGSEPARNKEVLQSWEALKSLNDAMATGNQEQDLASCLSAAKKAANEYDNIQIQLDSKSNGEHLQPMTDGVTAFKKLAEI
jgi:hypothetical protein